MNAFAAQNYGAGNMHRVKKGYHLALLSMTAWGLLITALFVFMPVQ
ncbi:MAG: hypothetical protein IIW37_06375, partial [Bacteroidaceae bacterium]|nr:hypothetical protein [Bacteroidaceae bacterium]